MNWGKSIVLAFIVFISFIMFFLVKTFTQKEYDYDLVSEHYYEDELGFQKDIDHEKNVEKLLKKVVFKTAEDSVTIVLPNESKQVIIGKINFYRPSNQKLDFIQTINSKNNEFVFTSDKLVKGRWDVSITWHYKNNPKEVYFKKDKLYF